ncbi:MAG: DUF5620 domain-containing protein, partial [Ruminococcus sp.]|nr:DUF5620 domain-containing protein [Ruminococcus sp.]
MKKFSAFFLALLILSGTVSCGGKNDSSSPVAPVNESSEIKTENQTGTTELSESEPETTSETETEPPTEAPTEHVSPVETVSTELGIQQTVNKTINVTEGSNTLKLPLADFIEEGDKINSFTFVIYSADGANIGEFKGGCGISVNEDCVSATDEGWYQSDDFTAPTEGTYGEITWNVPAGVSDSISAAGDVLFGYWWGNAGSIRVSEVICSITRTREIPCDGTAEQNVGQSVSYDASDDTIRVKTDFLPAGAVPQMVTYNISSAGGFGKFVGAFGYSSSLGDFQSPDIAVMTDSSNLSLTWIVDTQAKNYAAEDGEIVLGYWWSEQSYASLDSVSVKYSLGGNTSSVTASGNNKTKSEKSESGFRDSSEIVKQMKVGWNLGNSLECYGTTKSCTATETGWGNPKATEDMIKSVKNAGFNSIRIPVTWGEHMDGDIIQSEWLDRVQEVVDYAYNNDMFVILNMHHDDYIWFNPTDEEYPDDSAKLKKIWEQ